MANEGACLLERRIRVFSGGTSCSEAASHRTGANRQSIVLVQGGIRTHVTLTLLRLQVAQPDLDFLCVRLSRETGIPAS